LTVSRAQARLFLALVPSVAAALRASSAGFGELGWAELRALYWLVLRDGQTVDELAAHLVLDAGHVSRTLATLHKRGLVRAETCAEAPERCSRANGSHRGCSAHHLQWLTDEGRALASEWERPYLAVMQRTAPSKWLGLGSGFLRARARRRSAA
jgi:hypothetical protein